MDEITVQRLCSAIVNPLSEKLNELTDMMNNKIESMFKCLETRLNFEIGKRDEVINQLSEKLDIVLKERQAEKSEIGALKHQIGLLETERTSDLNINVNSPTSGWINTFSENPISLMDRVIKCPNEIWSQGNIEEQSTEEKPTIDLLIVGDSCTKHLDLNLTNPGKNNELKCIRGGRVHGIRESVKKYSAENNISHCVIHVGTNDTSDAPPHLVTERLLSLMKEMKCNMPQTKIYFSQILPKYDDSWLKCINAINHQMFLSRNSIGFTFIGHYDFATQFRRLICKDGIHPSYSGVEQLARDIQLEIK